MPQKPQLALYEYEAEKYLAILVTSKGTPAGDTEKQKTRKALAYMTALLKERGHSWPDAGDYATYKGGHDDANTRQNVSRIEKFFAWLKKETERMPENGTTATLDAETSQPELFSELDTPGVEASASTDTESETWPDADTKPDTANEPVQATKSTVKSKAGRKRLDGENGEIRDKKLTVYMTEMQNRKFKLLCLLKHVESEADFVLKLITAEIEKNEDALSLFLEAEKLVR